MATWRGEAVRNGAVLPMVLPLFIHLAGRSKCGAARTSIWMMVTASKRISGERETMQDAE